MMRLQTILLALSIAVATSGCGTLSRPSTPEFTRLYLDGAAAQISRAEPVAMSLTVAVPRAEPGYASPRFAYMEDGQELEYYGRHEWASDPGRMILPAVIRALEESGRFAAVVSPRSPAIADVRLDLEVIRLLHDYRAGQGELVLTVRAQLTSFDDRRVVATQMFDLREAAGTGPARGAAAADRALARFLEQLTEFCVEHTGG